MNTCPGALSSPLPAAPATPAAPCGRRRLALGALFASLGSGGWAQVAPGRGEYRIKAAYLIKFLGYIEWPHQVFERDDTPLAIGVLGAAVLVDELVKAAAGRSAGGRPIAVRRLRADEAVDDLQVLFVSRADTKRLPALATQQAPPRERALLVVTEVDDAMPGDSAINFVVADDKVLFDIATPVLERAGLHVSARLLTVARKVIAGPP